MSARVDFFFDVVCPYAYLAHTQIERVCEAAQAELVWRPILLGGLFREIGASGDGPVASMPAAKAELNLLDMRRWAAAWEVPLNMPATHPNRSVLAMRAIIASDDIPRAAKALYLRYWRDGLDVSSPTVVRDALDAAGFDGDALLARCDSPTVKDDLKRRTGEAAAAGAFGVPTFVVENDGRRWLIFGQDRLHFVAAALAGTLPNDT